MSADQHPEAEKLELTWGEQVFDKLANQLMAATVGWKNFDHAAQLAQKPQKQGGPSPEGEFVFPHVALDVIIEFIRSSPGWQKADLALPLERLEHDCFRLKRG